jgi:SAM-dependent methyltransferase
MNTADLMRQDWNQRARADAFHFIASWRKDWTPESFFESGEEDYQSLVAPVFVRQHYDPRGKIMLELGCGAGRMTRSFAERFSLVYGFDISEEMLRHAKALLPDAGNVTWTLGNGTDFAGLGDESVDFAFSYIVLQHMPEPEFAHRYIREILRVLKPGGLFLFQFNSVPRMTMNWKGRLAWGIVDFPWALGFRGVSRSVASLLGLSPEIAGKSWRGASPDVTAVIETVGRADGIVKEIAGEKTFLDLIGIRFSASRKALQHWRRQFRSAFLNLGWQKRRSQPSSKLYSSKLICCGCSWAGDFRGKWSARSGDITVSSTKTELCLTGFSSWQL